MIGWVGESFFMPLARFQEQAFGSGFQEQAFGSEFQERAFGSEFQEQAFGSEFQERAFGSEFQEQAFGSEFQEQINLASIPFFNRLSVEHKAFFISIVAETNL